MPRIATIGFFDGVHRGHRFLFAQLHEHAKHHHLSPAIYTFDRHPKELLTGQAPAMLTTNDERRALLQNYGEVHFLDFAAVQHLTAEQFMRYLHEQEDVQVLLIGYDHHFGSDRLKGFHEYEKIAHKIGLHVERAHECLVDSLPVSSSRIRKLLAASQIDQVNRLLGYLYHFGHCRTRQCHWCNHRFSNGKYPPQFCQTTPRYRCLFRCSSSEWSRV